MAITWGLCRAMIARTSSYSPHNRTLKPSRGAVRITPHSTSEREPRGSPESSVTMPYPVAAVPGSMPKTITPSHSRFRHFGEVDVEVRVDFLYVVQIVQLLHQLEQRLRRLPPEVHRGLRNHRDLGAVGGDALRVERCLHRVQRRRIRRDHEAVVFAREIFGTRLERGFERGLFIDALRRHENLTLALEHPRHRVRRAQIPAAARQLVANVGHRARRVVGERVNQERDTAGPERLVRDFLILYTLELASALLDRPLDVVLGHGCRARRLDGRAQPRITARIAATGPCRDRDFPNELRKDGAALRVGRRLVVLDLLPFTVTGHVTLETKPEES